MRIGVNKWYGANTWMEIGNILNLRYMKEELSGGLIVDFGEMNKK